MYLNNLSVLPWYASKDDWNCHKWWSFGAPCPLITPLGYIPTFQLVLPSNVSVVDHLYLYDATLDDEIADILGLMSGVTLYTNQQGYSILVNKGTDELQSYANEGCYYLVAEANGKSYISDVFAMVERTRPYLKISWRCSSNLETENAPIIYVGNFKNVLYIWGQIGRPTYEYEEEGKNLNGYFMPMNVVSYKKYAFNCIAPEYLCDVMRTIPLSDEVEIQDQWGRTYAVSEFGMEASWFDQGYFAKLECEFNAYTVVKVIGRAIGSLVNPDFNNDFNEDYLI